MIHKELALAMLAETPKVYAKIHVLFGEKLIVECNNRELESKALRIALKS